MDVIRELKPYFKNSPASQQLDTLERHISSYSFEEALDQLNQILDTLGISLET